MARRARSHIFDEQAPKRRLSLAAIPPATVRGLQIIRGLLTPRLMALSGLALFGWALVVAFRVISMDAAHRLKQPAIDFAICGGLGLLGLSISWIHLGEHRPPPVAAEDGAQPRLLVPRSLQRSNPPQLTSPQPLLFRRPLVPRASAAAGQRKPPRPRG